MPLGRLGLEAVSCVYQGAALEVRGAAGDSVWGSMPIHTATWAKAVGGWLNYLVSTRTNTQHNVGWKDRTNHSQYETRTRFYMNMACKQCI